MQQATQPGEQPSAGPPAPHDDPRRLAFALRDIVHNGRRLHTPVATIDRGAIALLFRLVERGATRGSELAQHACLDASTVSRHLRALDGAGYVTRRPDPDDARAVLFEASAAGYQLVSHAVEESVALFARVTEHWAPSDLAHLTRLACRLAEDLEKL